MFVRRLTNRTLGFGAVATTLRNVTASNDITSAFVTKGTRVHVSYLQAAPLGTYSVAGVQMKVSATAIELDGVVTHVWGYGHPTNITKRTFVVLPDGGGAEIEVPESGITGVLPFDADPPGLESYEAPDGWWVLGREEGTRQVTALSRRFSGPPTMIHAYPAGHEADGWSTFPSKTEACKAAWHYYALTATKVHA